MEFLLRPLPYNDVQIGFSLAANVEATWQMGGCTSSISTVGKISTKIRISDFPFPDERGSATFVV